MAGRLVAIILLNGGGAGAQSGEIPAGFGPIDSSFRAFMQSHSLPGASLAIAKDGRLVHNP